MDSSCPIFSNKLTFGKRLSLEDVIQKDKSFESFYQKLVFILREPNKNKLSKRQPPSQRPHHLVAKLGQEEEVLPHQCCINVKVNILQRNYNNKENYLRARKLGNKGYRKTGSSILQTYRFSNSVSSLLAGPIPAMSEDGSRYLTAGQFVEKRACFLLFHLLY